MRTIPKMPQADIYLVFCCGSQVHMLGFHCKGVKSGWQRICYSPALFTELSLLFLEKQFFLRVPLAGTQVTVLLRRLREKRQERNLLHQSINIYGWLEQIWSVREHCFNFVGSLEGNLRRHQNLYNLTSLELNFQDICRFLPYWF